MYFSRFISHFLLVTFCLSFSSCGDDDAEDIAPITSPVEEEMLEPQIPVFKVFSNPGPTYGIIQLLASDTLQLEMEFDFHLDTNGEVLREVSFELTEKLGEFEWTETPIGLDSGMISAIYVAPDNTRGDTRLDLIIESDNEVYQESILINVDYRFDPPEILEFAFANDSTSVFAGDTLAISFIANIPAGIDSISFFGLGDFVNDLSEFNGLEEVSDTLYYVLPGVEADLIELTIVDSQGLVAEASVSIDQIFSVDQSFMTGEYRVEQLTNGVFGDVFNASPFTVIIVAEFGTDIIRSFEAEYLPQFGLDITEVYQFELNFSNQEVIFLDDQPTGLSCTNDPLIMGTSDTNGLFDGIDDSSFTLILKENVTMACGAPAVDVEFLFTKQ